LKGEKALLIDNKILELDENQKRNLQDFKDKYDDIWNYFYEWNNSNKSLIYSSNLKEFLNGLYEKMSNLIYIDEKRKIVTYCGGTEQKPFWKILRSAFISKKNNNTDYFYMSLVPMGEILNSNGFILALSLLIQCDDEILENSINTDEFIKNILGQEPQNGNRSKYAKDINGKPIEGLLTIFDYCSEKIVGANASGNTLFVGNKKNGDDNVFVLTELPTLLNNSDVKMIDGIDTSLLLKKRFSNNNENLKEIFECLVSVSDIAFVNINGKNAVRLLDEVSELKEFSKYGLDEKKILGSDDILDSDEAVDLYFTKREGSKLCLAA